MFGEIKIVTPYFLQMTLYSKTPKIIYTLFQKWAGVRIILEWIVNYFEAECQLFLSFWDGVFSLKIGCMSSVISL